MIGNLLDLHFMTAMRAASVRMAVRLGQMTEAELLREARRRTTQGSVPAREARAELERRRRLSR